MRFWNDRGRILKIRPGHLANFSGGAGYMPFIIIFSVPASALFAVLGSLFLTVRGRRLLGVDGGSKTGLHEFVRFARWHTLACLIIAVVAGLIAKMSPSDIVNKMIEGAGCIAGGALVIGLARGIQVVLDMGHISDTIVNGLASPLQGLPTTLSAILMTLVHSVINFFIPSGSGQAMATMPIMIPLSDLIGMTRQTAIMAFQVGDGIMNMIFPTMGGMLAMIALARVPFDRWFRFVFPLVMKILLVSWVFLAVAVYINWGPA